MKPINVILHINDVKKKYQMIILVDGEKTFNENQHLFVITTLRELRIEDFLNMIKRIYKKKCTTNIILNGDKLEAFLFQTRNNVRIFPSPTAFQFHNGSSNQCNKTRKRNTGNTDWKEEIKLPLFTNDIII